MSIIDRYQTLKKMNLPAISTNDVTALFNISSSAASKFMTNLVKTKLAVKIKRGVWVFQEGTDPLYLPQLITAPLPSYISLQTALYLHGMISQMSSVIYAVSLARTKKTSNAVGTISIHHIQPTLFIGFNKYTGTDINIATPEKALFDFCYFNSARSGLFHQLPEYELTENFDYQLLEKYTSLIESSKQRIIVDSIIKGILSV